MTGVSTSVEGGGREATVLYGSRKYTYPHRRGSLEIPRGVLKAKIFKGMYEPRLEFLEEWGFKPKKTLRGGEYG